MSEKILYILGAGASSEAMPLSRSIYKDDDRKIIIKNGLADDLRSIKDIDGLKNLVGDDKKFIVECLDDFLWLANNADKFYNVDTFAKYLYHTNSTDFDRLKQTLTRYFAFKQTTFHNLDSRYISWLISIMENYKIPENVKILSWNYDFQLQLATTIFRETEGIYHSSPNSYTYGESFIPHYPNLDPHFNDFDRLSHIHLNGIAGYFKYRNNKTTSVFESRYKELPDLVTMLRKAEGCLMHFAWEQSGYHDQLMDHVEKLIDGTTIIVVIGYSFPFFNRAIDKRIFRKLVDKSGTFPKIYYQDPILTGENLRAQFGLSGGHIIHVRDTDNFHIPYEL